jgi:alpha-L-fucosidase
MRPYPVTSLWRPSLFAQVRSAGHDANLLLNVGPGPDGAVPAELATALEMVGAWLQGGAGEALYGTRGGPMRPAAWGVMTSREGARPKLPAQVVKRGCIYAVGRQAVKYAEDVKYASSMRRKQW